MRYRTRTAWVLAEASGQRVIESVREDGWVFRSTVKWTSLSQLDAGATFTRDAAIFGSLQGRCAREIGGALKIRTFSYARRPGGRFECR
jgi:hypothetical protein